MHLRDADLVQPSSYKVVALAAKPKNTIRTSVILPAEARARVEALAGANDVSSAWVIRHAVLRFLEEHGDQTELPLRLPARKVSAG